MVTFRSPKSFLPQPWNLLPRCQLLILLCLELYTFTTPCQDFGWSKIIMSFYKLEFLVEILAWLLTDTDFPTIKPTNCLAQHDFEKSIQSTSDINYTVGLNIYVWRKKLCPFACTWMIKRDRFSKCFLRNLFSLLLLTNPNYHSIFSLIGGGKNGFAGEKTEVSIYIVTYQAC